MNATAQALGAVRQGAGVALVDFRAFYSWHTWLGGWLVRILCQVTFYSMIGTMVGDPGYVTYVVIGAAVMVCVAESLMTAASTTWDSNWGTVPLLAAAPVEPGWYYVGRSLMWPLSGTATTTIALFAMTPFFDVPWTAARIPLVVPLVLVTSLTTYCMALAVGALALRVPGARNVMSALVTMAITAFCGAVVPVGFWPAAIRWAAQTVPVTHGLQALRGLQDGTGPAEVAGSVGLALLAGAAWLVVAVTAFHRLFATARRGSAVLG